MFEDVFLSTEVFLCLLKVSRVVDCVQSGRNFLPGQRHGKSVFLLLFGL